ncbi:MAG: hypothetical protein JSS02_28280 [Planctomycetes bacterium]|nr:hypothetical protein [Planctomycetota bacterium]
MLSLSRKCVGALRQLHNDEGGESGIQMVAVLALAAVCMFGVGKLAGIGAGEGGNSGLFGGIKDKIKSFLPSAIGSFF